MGSAPCDRLHIESVVVAAEIASVDVDDGDVVAFTAESIGDVRADLAGSHYDYVHGTVLPRVGTHVGLCRRRQLRTHGVSPR